MNSSNMPLTQCNGERLDIHTDRSSWIQGRKRGSIDPRCLNAEIKEVRHAISKVPTSPNGYLLKIAEST
jgi:hypothetical protein